jgi:hypothetical protein
MRATSLLPITAVIGLAGVAVAADAVQWRSNAEYGFTAGFPGKTRPVVAGSWQHAHGWAISLGGKGEVKRGIGVQGDYNAVEAMTPQDAIGCSAPYLVAGAQLHLSFPNRKSATCREDHAEGFILITVVTQAGNTEGEKPGDPPVPRINYKAGLTTTPSKIVEDLATFRHVLASVRIHPDKTSGP